MTPEITPPEPLLLSSLRRRQQNTRTAQVARALDVPAKDIGGAFNADAAAALNHWKGE